MGYTGNGDVMSLQLRCICGWTSQVSEYYLGDHIACPDCGVKLNVHAQAGVPYGYAPYPIWQKRTTPAQFRPGRRRAYPLFTPQDPNAAPTFWLGMFALLLVFTGCGAIPGVMLALFGVTSWARSRRFAKQHKQVHQSRANVGLGMSVLAIGLAGVMLVGLFVDEGRERTSCRHSTEYRNPGSTGEYRHPGRRDSEPYHTDEMDRTGGPAKQGYYYPDATPAEPRDDFERRQVEYSRKIREQRKAEQKSRQEALSPAGRYGD